MEEFFKRLVAKKKINPPEACLTSFLASFDGAINATWSKMGEEFEVLFYRNELEHIANFLATGELKEYRMILPKGSLPERVKHLAEDRGEIMNQILVNKGNLILYEVIIRDEALHRHLMEMTELGEIIKSKVL